MNQTLVDKIAAAVLYEGYILYPYRPSSLKNKQRWTFGGLYPRAYSEAHAGSDAWSVQTECLLSPGPQAALEVKAGFLHLMQRTVGKLAPPLDDWSDAKEPEFEPVESLQVGEERYQSWREAVEREVVLDRVELSDLVANPRRVSFSYPGDRILEPVFGGSGEVAAVLVREQEALAGEVSLLAAPAGDGLLKVTVNIFNQSPLDGAGNCTRDAALMRALVSSHTILHLHGGEFLSLIDPPKAHAEAAEACRNVGAWPVLVGEEGQRDTMLSSPIILYDYPEVAPESPGDLFDCTEIDEILTLRILTLTDDERREAIAADPRARTLMERTEALARDQLLGLHGAMRGVRSFQDEE